MGGGWDNRRRAGSRVVGTSLCSSLLVGLTAEPAEGTSQEGGPAAELAITGHQRDRKGPQK